MILHKYRAIISKFRTKKVLVVGDVILDQHIRGSVSRISPEAPVPIVLQQGDPDFAPGGAANVATNLKSLGAKVTVLGRIGDDGAGQIFLRELRKRKISTKGIFVDKNIPTIVKTRIVAQHQQILRIDREQIDSSDDEKLPVRVSAFLRKYGMGFDAIILSDYGKGMISRVLVEQICSLAKKNRQILTVDPKVEHFAYYRGVTAITPNKNETENAIRNIKITNRQRRKLALHSDRLQTHSQVEKAGKQLVKFLELESLLITLGEEGMYLFKRNGKSVHIPTKTRDVFDVTGAGDTVIAVFTLGLTTGATKLQAADIANHAAGIVVGQMGAVTVTREELLAAMKN